MDARVAIVMILVAALILPALIMIRKRLDRGD
jgi:hypothetical protein